MIPEKLCSSISIYCGCWLVCAFSMPSLFNQLIHDVSLFFFLFSLLFGWIMARCWSNATKNFVFSLVKWSRMAVEPCSNMWLVPAVFRSFTINFLRLYWNDCIYGSISLVAYRKAPQAYSCTSGSSNPQNLYSYISQDHILPCHWSHLLAASSDCCLMRQIQLSRVCPNVKDIFLMFIVWVTTQWWNIDISGLKFEMSCTNNTVSLILFALAWL